jgi:hypothetical protein
MRRLMSIGTDLFGTFAPEAKTLSRGKIVGKMYAVIIGFSAQPMVSDKQGDHRLSILGGRMKSGGRPYARRIPQE